MAHYGADVAWIKCTTVSATAAWQDITQSVEEFSGLDLEALLHESHTLGDAWPESIPTGMKKLADIVLKGPYDDAASTGIHTIFGNATDLGAERVLKFSVGTTNAYPKVDVIVQRYRRDIKRGEITMYELVLRPTGAVTVVTT